MLDKFCETDTISSVNHAVSSSNLSQHHWKIYLRNGAVLDFEAGWKPYENQPSPATFLRDFEQFQSCGTLPQRYDGAENRIYRFSRTKIGSILALDLREVVAVQVDFRS